MESKEFTHTRHYLGKTQKQLAQLLCVSSKAIQSFEQGWRSIPASAERQLLVLLSFKRAADVTAKPCWEIKDCRAEWRDSCIVWEYKARYFCWFLSGTFCQGEFQKNWQKKIELCRQCEVFQSIIPVPKARFADVIKKQRKS